MSEKTYLRVHWLHHLADDPVELWSELDAKRIEIRKIEIWRDGRVGYASNTTSSGGTMLGVVQVPLLAEIVSNPEFDAHQITKAEFENCWRASVR